MIQFLAIGDFGSGYPEQFKNIQEKLETLEQQQHSEKQLKHQGHPNKNSENNKKIQ